MTMDCFPPAAGETVLHGFDLQTSPNLSELRTAYLQAFRDQRKRASLAVMGSYDRP